MKAPSPETINKALRERPEIKAIFAKYGKHSTTHELGYWYDEDERQWKRMPELDSHGWRWDE